MSSSCCATTEHQFDEAHVRDEVKAYRRGSLPATTRLLNDALRGRASDAGTLLDIGGGLGAVSHGLLTNSNMSATIVEMSSAFLSAARDEANERGLSERISFVHGDFVTMAPELDAAEVVSLDRVVCCYPDYVELIARSTEKCGRWYALSYPRDTWIVHIGTRFRNWRRRRRGLEFQTFMHSEKAMDELIQSSGFARIDRRGSIIWMMALYRKSASP